MTSKILFIFLLLCFSISSHAQISDSRVTIDTVIRPAIFLESSMSESDTKDAIESYFDSMHIEKEKGKGFIIKKSLGYMLFRRAKVEYVSDMLDYYFVTDTKKQKGADASTVYIAVSKGYNNFFSPENDKAAWSQLKDFASYLQTNYFEQFKLNTSLASVSKDLDKQQKKLIDLLKEKSQLEASISSDSAQIASLRDQLLKLKAKKQ